MKLKLSVLFAGTIVAAFVATLTTTAAAMPSGAVMEEVPGLYPMDCSKWKDRARCAILNQYIKECRDKTDDAWRECMHLPAPAAAFAPPRPRDCSTARNKARCEAHTRALNACTDKLTRAEHRKCVTGQLQAQAAEKN